MAILFVIGIVIVIALIIVLLIFLNKKIENKLINLANQGDAKAQYDLARRYQRKKPNEALQLFEKSANSGNAKAQLALGIIYKEGNGVEKNPVQAVHWFEQAAEQGLADAQYELGYCHMMGQGIKEDDVKAFNWFEKAAANGSTNAKKFKSLTDVQYKMAITYKAGEEGKQKNPVQAVAYFQKAADLKHADSQYELACCYMMGQGVKEDDVKAFSWFQKAAANGSTNAIKFKTLADVQYEMGLANSNDQATVWFKKAADQGHAEAQYKLALGYLSKDPGEAVSWLMKAANQGHADAQYELGCCYMRGKGVAENKRRAINWFEKAVANGANQAQKERAREVVGYKELNQHPEFNSTACTLVKEMQYDLLKAGYNLSSISHNDDSVSIIVSGQEGNTYVYGTIGIYSPSKRSPYNISLTFEWMGFKDATDKCMLIIDETLGLYICSTPEQFPKWLKICANLLKGKVSDPKWIYNPEFPFCREYVNSVFKVV